MDLFWQTFGLMSQAMSQILLIAVAAGFLVRRGWVQDHEIQALAAVTIHVLLPCMIFSKLLQQFDPWATPGWYGLPLIGIGLSGTGLLVARLLFRRDWREKRLLLAMSSLQNAAYMSLPIGRIIFRETASYDRFAMYCFLFILGYSPLLWSVGKALTSETNGTRSGWRGFITPPFVANVLGVVAAFVAAGRWLPRLLLESASLLGEATVPLATFVLGATVGGISFRRPPALSDATRVVLVKLILLPALMVTALAALAVWRGHSLPPILGDFLVIQAASPPATALALQVRKYGGDAQQTGAMLLLLYLLCTVTLPLWVALWRMAAA